jgi:hypothetical protein
MTTKTEKATETNAFSALGDALESAAEKFEEGSAVARQSAKEAAKVTRRVFADGVYNSAYWVSFGVVYSAVYLTELLPENNTFRKGLEEGATAAQTKAHGTKEAKAEDPVPAARSSKPKPKNKGGRTAKRRPEKEPDVAANA